MKTLAEQLKIIKRLEKSIGKKIARKDGLNPKVMYLCYQVEGETITGLQLDQCKLSDDGLEEIAQLDRLKTLILRFNHLSDIRSLGELKGLTSLDLCGNSISDISILGKLKGLRSLGLVGNPISDISILGELKELTSLNLSHNKISEILNLSELRNLSLFKRICG